MLEASEEVIVDLVNIQLQQIDQKITDKVNDLNALIANHTDTTFLFDLFKKSMVYLNYTIP